ncbi:hypothetical protein D9756_008008 [Leucocoprinus leucothites]|uniref:Casein kinase substrate phosphoprotein PP28 domain-containing protein n=1 Tax=Leucocoprinus leucothites TaxID=201217 RepID=A0A8H5FYG1_9AGAR|nr:hypothetical protein D9756_008008 [Leucoagaricus leucothites]
MVRKFKTKRGGGRSFSRNMTIDRDASSFPDGKDPRSKEEEEEDDDSEEEEPGEEEEEEEEEEDSDEEKPELTRAQRKELKKKQVQAKQAAKEPGEKGEEDEDEDLINPNHVQKKLTISDLSNPRELSRREREQKEKKEAQERYWKLHLQGKTDQAKTDLARLAKIRAEREAAAAKRQAEAQEKAKETEAKKSAQLNRRGGKV